MCTVSMVMDDWMNRNPTKNWPDRDLVFPTTTSPGNITGPSQKEFDDLKAEVKSLKKLLKAAKIYDEETGQPDCEMADKVKMIKDLAEMLDIDMSDVFTTK